MWLDRGALDKIAFQTPESIEACSVGILHEEARAPLKQYKPFPPHCLSCPNRMTKMHFMGQSRILLDYCEQCGSIWVDGGELTKINQYIHWFDNESTPSKFGRFFHHARSTFFHRIDVTMPVEMQKISSY
jgi:Zn-finger nucleic acid-binding protein